MKTNQKLIGIACLGATMAITTALTAPLIAGKGATPAELAGVINNGSVDAIIAKLEKAENMPSPPSTIALVEGLLEHDDYRAREAAAWWFARRPFHKDRLTADARTALASGNSVAVRNAADMLGTFRHPRVVSALVAASERTNLDADARLSIVRALGTIGNIDANPAIAAVMSDDDASVRHAAVEAWSNVLHQADAIPVTPLLSDSDAQVRRIAARVAGKFSETTARTALEGIVQNDDDVIARRNAAFALGQIGDAASRAVLTEAAENDESALVRGYAKAALRKVGLR